jgi:hypothetical protein
MTIKKSVFFSLNFVMFFPWRHRRCLKADPCLQRHLTAKLSKSNVDESFSLESREWGCTTGNAATVAHSTKKTKRKRFRDRRATFTTVYVVGW